MQIPKILKPFLRPTSEEKTPTDTELDHDIEYVSFLLHHIWPVLKSVIRNKARRFLRYRWKFVLGRTVFFIGVAVLAYFAFVKVLSVRVVRVNAPAHSDECMQYRADTSMNLRNFLTQIMYVESRYNKRAKRDSSQYWGLYQIGRTERCAAGYGDVPMAAFLSHQEIQDLCMIGLLKHNRNNMKKYIGKYSGKVVDGILVTESGVLALCHLGCGAAQKYLDSGVVPDVDENGNSPRTMLKLGGYDLLLDKVRFSIDDSDIQTKK